MKHIWQGCQNLFIYICSRECLLAAQQLHRILININGQIVVEFKLILQIDFISYKFVCWKCDRNLKTGEEKHWNWN